tara:strand:- start:5211 stop:6452 length:1242 start_codon:yes stop_codon:yes gene_type:complete
MIARLVGLLKEIVIAKEFGLSAELDTYFLAILIPMYAVVSLTNPLGPTFIPVYNRLEIKGKEEAQVLFSKILGYVFYGSVALALIYWILIPFLSIVLNVDATNESLFRSISLLFVPIVVVQSISNYLLPFLENRKLFIFTSMGTVLSSLGVLVFIYLFSSILSIAAGMLASALLFLFIQIVALLMKGNVRLIFSFKLDRVETGLKKQYSWLLLASATMGSTLVVDQYMASFFGVSSVSGLNYGYKLAGIVCGLGSISLATVALPVFSKLIAQGNKDKVQSLVRSVLSLIAFLSIPLVVVIYLYSDEIISLIFERGAFKAVEVDFVSELLKFYILQFPFYVGGVVLSRLMSTLGKNDQVFVISFVALILNVMLNIGFTKWIGISGIALSTSVVYLFTFIALFFTSGNALQKDFA